MTAGKRPTTGDEPRRPRLLVADDDPVVRSLLCSQLEGDFDVVAVAEDTAEAIELAEKHRPDAALIDVQMPGGGALEAVPQIVARSPETCLVVLSADDSDELVVRLINAGATAYVRKGVTSAEIAKVLTDSLKAQANVAPI
ncbi:MAG: response regulator transcription factor [Thermoleophilaceae bacterium]|nr:response regulator transcription factor [Thermoleophilaceae bacterium]